MYKEPLVIEVIASDPSGYQVKDTLVIAVDMSFSYILSIIITIAGPLVTIFGLCRYKNYLYEIFCKGKYRLERPLIVHPEEELEI